MKYIIAIIALMYATDTFSQKTDLKHIPKKTTKIILENDLSKDDNFSYVIETLLDNDFSIADKDAEYATIETDLEEVNGLNASYHFIIRTKANQIIIRGKYIIHATIDYGGAESKPSFSNIENRGMRGSVSKKSFAAMYEFAQLLESDKMNFEL
ncbi:hypothetical protein LCM02_11585 [Lutimonas saemankumensis]|uniref:hypothetical protein n=1 Tax=Lutimonas saemankumensis TaxID=483016 RepID=UPI001CD5832B|nr:hypothetical protein [Lutimonas saemankumensis]MCA0933097.1 hypothetical protein [Lutimonas saemankumensis]